MLKTLIDLSNPHPPYRHGNTQLQPGAHGQDTIGDTSRDYRTHTLTLRVIHHRGDPLCHVVIGCRVGLVLRPVDLLILQVSVGPLSVKMFVVQCSISHSVSEPSPYAPIISAHNDANQVFIQVL